MPLNQPHLISHPKEFISSMVGNHSIRRHIPRLRETYGIPAETIVKGMKLPYEQRPEVLYSSLLQTAAKMGIRDTDIHTQHTVVPLPPVFSDGCLTFEASKDDEPGKHEVALSFTGAFPPPVIQYKTHEFIREPVSGVLRKVVLLAAIPNEILQEVEKFGSIIVVGDQYTKGWFDHEGYYSSQVLKLVYEKESGTIIASDIHVDPAQFNDNVSELKKANIQESINQMEQVPKVYFILSEDKKDKYSSPLG